MKSYCVIEFKDKDEKKQVLTLLSDTEVNLTLTTDLKGFVAKQFNVTILENVVVSPNDIDTVAINRTIVENTVDVAPKTGDTFQNGQHFTQSSSKECCHKTNDAITSKDVLINNIVEVPQLIDNNTDTIRTGQQTPIPSASNIIVAQPPVLVNITKNSIETKVDMGDRFGAVSPTIQNKQHHTQAFSIPDPIVDNQPVPVIDDTQNLMNIDDYGTYVPYLERPVEPKKENVDDAAEVGDNENHQDITNMYELFDDGEVGEHNESMVEERMNEVANRTIDDVLMTNQVDIPSPTMKRRSCRSAKKPRYLIDEDSDEEEEYTPPTKYLRETNQTLEEAAGAKKKRTTCKKCGKEVNGWYSAKMDHVAIHTGIMKFKCLVDGCEVKCKLRGNMVSHMKWKHKNQLNAFTNIELTSEQNAEIDTMMYECFGEPDCNIDDHCQICNQKIGGNSTNSSSKKKEHALHHFDFMLYKCVEEGCLFQSKTAQSMKTHVRGAHSKIVNPTLTKIKLTAEQESEVEDIVIKCFPNLGEDGSSA